MDGYMDRTATRRVSPQEMIRANAAAEAAENERLRLQREQYRKEVASMKKTAETTQKSLENIEELIRKGSGRKDNEDILDALKELEEKLGKRADSTDEANHEVGVRVYRNVQAVVEETVQKQTEELSALIREGNTDEIAEKVSLSTEVMGTQFKETKEELFGHIDELDARNLEAAAARMESLYSALEETKLAAAQSERVLRPIVLISLILTIVNLAVNLLQVFGIL